MLVISILPKEFWSPYHNVAIKESEGVQVGIRIGFKVPG